MLFVCFREGDAFPTAEVVSEDGFNPFILAFEVMMGLGSAAR